MVFLRLLLPSLLPAIPGIIVLSRGCQGGELRSISRSDGAAALYCRETISAVRGGGPFLLSLLLLLLLLSFVFWGGGGPSSCPVREHPDAGGGAASARPRRRREGRGRGLTGGARGKRSGGVVGRATPARRSPKRAGALSRVA